MQITAKQKALEKFRAFKERVVGTTFRPAARRFGCARTVVWMSPRRVGVLTLTGSEVWPAKKFFNNHVPA